MLSLNYRIIFKFLNSIYKYTNYVNYKYILKIQNLFCMHIYLNTFCKQISIPDVHDVAGGLLYFGLVDVVPVLSLPICQHHFTSRRWNRRHLERSLLPRGSVQQAWIRTHCRRHHAGGELQFHNLKFLTDVPYREMECGQITEIISK